METVLNRDRYALRRMFRDMRDRRAVSDRLQRESLLDWAALLNDPRPFAADALDGHAPCTDVVCECGRVAENVSYAAHLLDVLHVADMLKVPPYMRREGW